MAGMSHPVFARVYERLSVVMDRAGAAEHRHALVAGLRGRVIEVGSGNGLTFSHYPPEVDEVVAVEPEPRLRAAALIAARTAPVPVRVVDGLAQALPGSEGEFDAVVAALVLCTVPDQAAALAEIRRVLRVGGQLRFLEHVAADTSGGMRRAQRLADATVWPYLLPMNGDIRHRENHATHQEHQPCGHQQTNSHGAGVQPPRQYSAERWAQERERPPRSADGTLARRAPPRPDLPPPTLRKRTTTPTTVGAQRRTSGNGPAVGHLRHQARQQPDGCGGAHDHPVPHRRTVRP
jgi:ubiquinone/menaquinone biosynthesis C-methylase UbiE